MSVEPEVRLESRPNGQRGIYAGLRFSFTFDQMASLLSRIAAFFGKPADSSPLAAAEAAKSLRESVARPGPVPRPGNVATDVAHWIVKHEARWKDGHIAVYPLPPGDGGGTLEVAGICNKYHPQECGRLVALISAGRYDAALRGAIDYWRRYTDPVSDWTNHPAVEFFLRDSFANRGPGGAAAILQIALNFLGQSIKVDASVGPVTRNSLAIVLRRFPAAIVIDTLRRARETYERNRYPWKPNARDESSKFWRGLSTRWAECATEAKRYGG